MPSTIILETPRLSLRTFTLNDAAFIIKLVNAPNWLEFIGDKGIKTQEDALAYLENTLLKSYADHGFGLWLVQLKATNTPIGMCGLVHRAMLAHVDIGFALLPDYAGLGYGFEIAQATMNHAKGSLGLETIVGITNSRNVASIKLLNKIGLSFEKTIKSPERDPILLFSPAQHQQERKAIDALTAAFFSLFTNTNGAIPQVDQIKDLFIPNGMIISNPDGQPQVYTLETFIAPREQILTDGTLTDFCEREVSHQTELFGNIAHLFSLYEKSGSLNGVYFEAKGMKTLQFVKVNAIWKMASVAWSDAS